MNKMKQVQDRGTAALNDLTAEALKGRQSVRATFKLSEHVINLLSLVANQLGLKQKTLFDQLIEDREVLAQIASNAADYRAVIHKRQQKTYVLSRNSLAALDNTARMYGIRRDLLVELSIQRLLPVVTAEQNKQEKRKRVLLDLDIFCSQGEHLLTKMESMLDKDDQIIRHFSLVLSSLRQGRRQLQGMIDLGRALENFDCAGETSSG
ncbi:MAG: hypothetical protein GXY53_05415 [Desulfobulbus sp.]|nr:hypothetical protein [Desulfobulbus sp.]